jgi:hypothetical protein
MPRKGAKHNLLGTSGRVSPADLVKDSSPRKGALPLDPRQVDLDHVTTAGLELELADLPQLNGYRTKSVASKVGLPKGGDVTRLTLCEYAATVRRRYGRAPKREKGRILDEFCQTTGPH